MSFCLRVSESVDVCVCVTYPGLVCTCCCSRRGCPSPQTHRSSSPASHTQSDWWRDRPGERERQTGGERATERQCHTAKKKKGIKVGICDTTLLVIHLKTNPLTQTDMWKTCNIVGYTSFIIILKKTIKMDSF